jgi:hypothetical protein
MFQYEPYQSPLTGSIAEIMGQQAQTRAGAVVARGQNTAHLIGSLGQIAQGAIGDYQQRKADAPRREMEQLQLRDARRHEASTQQEAQQEQWLRSRIADPSQPPPSYEELVSHLGAQRATAIQQGFQQVTKADLENETVTLDHFGRDLRWAMAMPGGMKQEAWQALKGKWAGHGLPADLIPEEYDEQVASALLLKTQKVPEAKAPEPFTLNPGDVRFGSDGKQIANVPPKPPDVNVGSFEDYLSRYAAERHLKPEQLSTKDVENARKKYQQSDDRPYRDPVPIVIVGPNGPMQVDRTHGTATAVTGPDGKPLGLVPTADQRNAVVSRERAQPVLASIAELSEKINTLQGVYAKMAGGVEKQKAKLNLDDDVAEYQSLVSMFTPMLARMVGHVGILTEQDVQSVRSGLPQPGDSKSLRDRKMARIKKILGEQGGGAEKPAPAPAAGGGLSYQDYLNAKKKPGGG